MLAACSWYTGAAWLSSARAVKCEIKFFNERNPYCRLLPGKLRTPARLPSTRWRKAGTTSSHHGPYAQGDTHATMAGTERSEGGSRSRSQKAGPSSDCSLQLDCMKLESLVIADQPSRGEYVPGPCTHRPSHHPSRGCPKRAGQPKGGRSRRYARRGG